MSVDFPPPSATHTPRHRHTDTPMNRHAGKHGYTHTHTDTRSKHAYTHQHTQKQIHSACAHTPPSCIISPSQLRCSLLAVPLCLFSFFRFPLCTRARTLPTTHTCSIGRFSRWPERRTRWWRFAFIRASGSSRTPRRVPSSIFPIGWCSPWLPLVQCWSTTHSTHTQYAW
jgi:hypothetical protein